MMKFIRSKKGFTLIEMLVVLIVIGLLVAIALPRFFGVSDDAKKRQCAANIRSMNTAIEMFNERTGSYPASLATVTGDVAYFPDGAPVCPYATAYVLGVNNRVVPHTH